VRDTRGVCVIAIWQKDILGGVFMIRRMGRGRGLNYWQANTHSDKPNAEKLLSDKEQEEEEDTQKKGACQLRV